MAIRYSLVHYARYKFGDVSPRIAGFMEGESMGMYCSMTSLRSYDNYS